MEWRSGGKMAARGVAAFFVVGSSAMALPGLAAAESAPSTCSGDGLTSLICQVGGSVTKGADGAADSLHDSAPQPLKGATGQAADVVKDLGGAGREAVGAEPAQPPQTQPGSGGGEPASKPATSGNQRKAKAPHGVPAPTSRVYRAGDATFGSLPVQGFSQSLLFDPFAVPEFGLLGEGSNSGDSQIRNAGRAEALPRSGDERDGVPSLLAVLALSAATAGLVRTWVLRKPTS